MRRGLAAIVALTVVTLLGAGLPQRTYAGINADFVVDDGGKDCVTANPFDASSHTTIHDALNDPNMSPGIAIYVCPGVYTEPTLFMIYSDTSLTGGPTLQESGTTTVRKALGSAAFMLGTRADRVTVSGFDFDATPPQGFVGQTGGIEGDGNDVVISNNIVHNTTVVSLGAIDVQDVLAPHTPPNGTQIVGNHVMNIGGAHMISCVCTNAAITDNVITGDGSFAVEVDGDGVTVSDNVVTDAGMKIYSNAAGVVGNHVTGGSMDVLSNNGVIDGNTLEDSTQEFLLSAGGDPLSISANTFRNTDRGAIFLYQPNATPHTSATIVQNTFDSVGAPIEMFDGNPGDVDLTTAVIGGSMANANTFINSGGTLGDTNYMVQLAGVREPINAAFNNWGLCTLAEIEQEIFHQPDDSALGLVDFDPFIDPGNCPTATPGTQQLAFGDVNCDGHANPGDALALVVHEAMPAAGSCPDIGDSVSVGGLERLWGDVNCSGVVDLTDAMAVLRHEAALEYEVFDVSCPEIGDVVAVG